MSLRIIEVVCPETHMEIVEKLISGKTVIDTWQTARNESGRRTVRILCESANHQDVIDDLQIALSGNNDWRLVMLPVEATVPLADDQKARISSIRRSLSREELLNEASRGAELDWHFLALVVLSTIVAAIGLLQDNVAVIIGAMVIAPLLGPNLALAFGAALGDRALIIQALKTNIIGVSLTLLLTAAAGALLPISPLESVELMARTEIGLDVLVLAFASGAAAVLSMTTGLSSALVGVMVAVALLPPAASVGLFIGAGHQIEAMRAALMLVSNIVCLSLAAQCVLLIKGIKPRTWLEKRAASQSTKITFLFWGALLIVIVALIFFLVPDLG